MYGSSGAFVASIPVRLARAVLLAQSALGQGADGVRLRVVSVRGQERIRGPPDKPHANQLIARS